MKPMLRKFQFYTTARKTNTNNTKGKKEEEEENKEQSRDLYNDIRGGSPIHFLTPHVRA